MGLSFSIPCDPCINKVSQWLDEKVACTHNLKKNLVSLTTTMEELKAKRDDLVRKVTIEEDKGLQRLAEIQVWLNRVEIVEKKVNDLASARNVQLQRLYLCGFCSRNLISSYRYGKSVLLMLREVNELKTRVFDVIAEKRPGVVPYRPFPLTTVGQKTMLDKAWKHLMEDGVGIMGLYGMGGVGKTTLLTQINNKFSNDKCGFDFVIWVVVSKELHVEKIQDEIAQKVGLGGGEWNQKNESQKGLHLYNFLMEKRFMLFLDDIWVKVDLAKIGIPDPTLQNRCKLAFTTRSLNVCTSMGVEKPMEVQCLADNDAFDLFQKKVGEITLGSDPEIPNLARKVAKKCCGLPLALNVVGETMSSKRTIQEWRHAIYVLNSYAAEFSGMDDKILPLLKYSYDSLKGDHLKSCLLYCALFPEDDNITKEKLIDYWICEGIIDGSEGIEKAEDKGYDIIGSLVGASLLMENFDYHGKAFDIIGSLVGASREDVRMHDVVREMALWIASDLGIQKETFIVRAGVGLCEIPKVKNWNIVKRMSLMDNKISHLVDNPQCLKLTTLLLQIGNLSNISSEFFKSMPKLAVLDLSVNHRLSELPEELSNLVSLQYLNLSSTKIHHLPKGLHELKKIIHLNLEFTRELESIAGISSLHNLKVLKLDGSGFPWDFDTVEELETLEHLEILTTTLDHGSGAGRFLNSHCLMSCTRILYISKRNLEPSEISLPETMDKLREFIIISCRISEIKMGRICSFLSLVKVEINDCQSLRELTFLMFAPNLRSLEVAGVKNLEDIINKEKACEVENSGGIVPFPNLNRLMLYSLPKLENIYWSSLPFPYLTQIQVIECPNLKKLPLDSKSGKQGDNGLFIKYGEKKWIEGVQWGDQATKNRFLASSRRLPDSNCLHRSYLSRPIMR